MVLADTSVWVEFLRHGSTGKAARMRALIEAGEVLLCGPVAAELVAGAGERERATLMESLLALPWAELDHAAWLAVGEAAAELKRRGGAVSLTDLAIAIAAARAGAAVWTADSDFARIAEALDELELIQLA